MSTHRSVTVDTPWGPQSGPVVGETLTPRSPYPLVSVKLESGGVYRESEDELL